MLAEEIRSRGWQRRNGKYYDEADVKNSRPCRVSANRDGGGMLDVEVEARTLMERDIRDKLRDLLVGPLSREERQRQQR